MHELVLHFIMAVLGGIGSITGSIIGAIVIIILPEYMRFILGYQEFIYGVIIVMIVLFAPQGVYGFIIRYLPGASHEKLYSPSIR
jgi:branched-chain amino acid transport system permease protein